jgi:hypothetical protein
MSEIFNTNDVPDDHAHWDALADRVTAAAIATSRTGRFAAPRALWIGVSLAFAASLVAMIASGPRPTLGGAGAISIALVPADDVGRAIALASAPPAVGELVLGSATGEAP